MGKNSSPVINYWYGLTMHMGECTAADTLYEVRGGDRTAWQGTLNGSGVININQPYLYGGEKSEGGLNGTLTVLNGDPTQVQSAILAPIEPGPRPAYRGLYTTVWDGDAGAASKSIKAISKLLGRWLSGWGVPVWHPELVQIGDGMNPAHIIYDLLTDPNCGGRDPASTFDDAQMLAAATTLYNEGFGLCLKWTSSMGLGKFVQTACDHVGAIWVEDPTTGLAYLKLIRADYDPTTLPVLDESNILKVLTYKQATLANAVNEVSVTYHDVTTNKDAAVAAQNLANVQAQGRVIQQSTSYPGLHTHDQAARAAMRDCTVASSLLLQIKVKVKSGGPNGLYGTKKGDVLSFSWGRKNLVSMPVRVLEADYGVLADNGITLTCVQDVFGLPATTYLVSQPSLWTAPNMAPQPVPLQVLEEASYRDLAAYMSAADLAQVGSTSGYLTTIANRPNGMSLNYTVKARVGTTGTFVEVGSGSFAPTAVLTADIGPTDTAIVLTDVDNLAYANVGGEALLGGERVRVDTIDTTTNAVTVARGCVDTVPALLHPAGTQIWFTEGYTGYGKTEYLTGELIQAILLTNTGLGQLDPTLALTGSLTLNDRQIRPYPPGNLQLQGVSYPAVVEGALAISWAHRDRLLQADQLIDTLQASIGPEVGTTYAVRVYLAGVLDSTTAGITGTTFTPVVSGDGTVTVQIDAVCNGLTSWQSLTATTDYYRTPRRVTESGVLRITESGAQRVVET
ncbi:MAG: hypothetical protein ACYCZD_12720 [Rhodanobacter sp.]